MHKQMHGMKSVCAYHKLDKSRRFLVVSVFHCHCCRRRHSRRYRCQWQTSISLFQLSAWVIFLADKLLSISEHAQYTGLQFYKSAFSNTYGNSDKTDRNYHKCQMTTVCTIMMVAFSGLTDCTFFSSFCLFQCLFISLYIQFAQS